MPDWLGYAPADLVPFSRPAYLRLFELYNVRAWPAALLGLAGGLLLLRLLRRPEARRQGIALAILAVCWLWVAWAFFLESYRPLNWAGTQLAVAFAAQGLLLGVLAATSPGTGARHLSDGTDRAGYGLIVFAVLAMPVISGAVGGRPWSAVELFGTAPDPTAVATLGLAAMLRRPFAWLLWPVPVLWLLVSTATLAVLDDPLWWLPLLSVLAAVIADRHGRLSGR